MKALYKKKIAITGSTGLLGSYFYNKFKKRYKIFKCKKRLESHNQLKKWINRTNFEFFIHFAALTNGKKKDLEKINTLSTINLLKSLNNHKKLKFFLFISTSHVYSFSNQKIKETTRTKPISNYGLSKKRVEDYIIKNRNFLNYKIGIARIFNITGPKQKKGHFIPDMCEAIKENCFIDNINTCRDFIHIDDVMESLKLIIDNKFEKPINIASGKKISLIRICKILNSLFYQKKISYGKKGSKDLCADNSLLKSLGKKKFKDINQILMSYKK